MLISQNYVMHSYSRTIIDNIKCVRKIVQESYLNSYITETEASKLTGMSVAWFQRDRWKGGGIPFVKMERSVRYNVRDLIDFMESRKCKSTTEAGQRKNK